MLYDRRRNEIGALPERVLLGIFIGNPSILAHSEGYTGFGGIPGFIQIVIAPNERNLPKLSACIAHEFQHNVLFHNARWNFVEVSLAQYLAVEGLAESFATSLYGEAALGPWVTGVRGSDLERTRRIIANSLDVRGFMEARKYVFGDHPLMPESEPVGVPYCGGYAAGYWAVQAFLKKTGMSVEEATLLDGEHIMRESGYFDVS